MIPVYPTYDIHSIPGPDGTVVYTRTMGSSSPKNDGGSASYYKLPRRARELQDLIEYRGMNFAIGNIFKAAYRMGADHSSEARDLRKIIWFAKRELKRIKKGS
jgi:hypothetical protein